MLKRQKYEILEASVDGPLHLLIGSTGIKAEGECHARNHGGPNGPFAAVGSVALLQLVLG